MLEAPWSFLTGVLPQMLLLIVSNHTQKETQHFLQLLVFKKQKEHLLYCSRICYTACLSLSLLLHPNVQTSLLTAKQLLLVFVMVYGFYGVICMYICF